MAKTSFGDATVTAVNAGPDLLMKSASNALAALEQATDGKEAALLTETTVGSLQALRLVIDHLKDEVVSLRKDATTQHDALRRIADLKVRSAGDYIAASRWKELTAELQTLAQTALEQDGKPASQGPRN